MSSTHEAQIPALRAELPQLLEGALDLLLDGVGQPVPGAGNNPFIWGGDLSDHLQLRPYEMRLGAPSAPIGLFWLLPVGFGVPEIPDSILGPVVAAIDAGEAVVIRGMDETGPSAVRDAVLPLCGGWNA